MMQSVIGVVGSVIVLWFLFRVIVTACDLRVWRLMRAEPGLFFRAVFLALKERVMLERTPKDED